MNTDCTIITNHGGVNDGVSICYFITDRAKKVISKKNIGEATPRGVKIAFDTVGTLDKVKNYLSVNGLSFDTVINHF